MLGHLSFGVADLGRAKAFYEAALAAGGTDQGAPGLREHHAPTYYAAFITDPHGHKLEAVHQ